MAKEYKLNKRTVAETIFMFLVGCLGIVLSYWFLTGKIPHDVVPNGTTISLKLMIGFVCVMMMSLGFGISIRNFFFEDVYSKLIYIPMEELDRQLYDNMLVLSFEGHAWSFTYNFKEIATHPNVRTIMYYNRKKKFKSFKLIPITSYFQKGELTCGKQHLK